MQLHLLIIDPQNDFCDPHGSLYVPGAEQDMGRLAATIRRLRSRLSAIHVTLDSHHQVDIAHPIWFRDSDGKAPAPFTRIRSEDLRQGRWSTRRASDRSRTLAYLEALEQSGRYPHTIWPEHCLIGSPGHNVWPELWEATQEWASRYALVDFVTKGSNPYTEHFSALQAEVPDPMDPSSSLNTSLIETLEDADLILLAGEALSHCLAHSVRDIVGALEPSMLSKLVLLTDATSNVPGFEAEGEAFLKDMRRLGLTLSDCSSVLRAA